MTSVSKHVDTYKLDDIVNKYNNTYHRTIKTEPVDVKLNTYINFSKEINGEDSKFEIGDMLEYQNIKTFLQKAMFQIGLRKSLLLQKYCFVHIYCFVDMLTTYLLGILKPKKLLECLTKKNCEKQIEKSLGLKK